MDENNSVKVSNRGFAAIAPEKQREISSLGGKTAWAKGTAHKFDTELAKRAGAIGGMRVSQNREHMREIGRKGGAARAAKRQNAPTVVPPGE